MPLSVPPSRIRALNDKPPNPAGAWVVYWMVAFRRPRFNFALQRAVELASRWKRPLLILEPLRCDYPWASDRLHGFVLQGMAENAASFANQPVTYHPYVEPARGAGKGLLAELGEKACAVVTDDYPCFFLPHMLAAAGRQVSSLLEAVDSNGLLPLRATDRVFPTAYAFRRFLQKNLKPHLGAFPLEDPLRRVELPVLQRRPSALVHRWPAASEPLLAATPAALAALPIDHSVGPVSLRGGHRAAQERIQWFVSRALDHYVEGRNEPEQEGTSRLSPYLHFGHTSTHEVFTAIAKRQKWTLAQLGASTAGARSGFWQMSEGAEAFIDQLVTWRELGFNLCSTRSDYDQFESLPTWAQRTLLEHQPDPRPRRYTLAQLEAAATHDPLWNAAQRQLVTEGWFHNYLRMLWGKKILEYTAHPKQALAWMIQLMNKYSLDGRDPNSYTGFAWVLGGYDRPWGPERPIFGKVRYMSSQNTARKLSVREYVARYGPSEAASPR